MDLRERKRLNNTRELHAYENGKPNYWLHGASSEATTGMIPTGINFAGLTINAFGGVKSSGDILQESGTSVGLGSGFSYLRQNNVDVGAQMDELSKQNTTNTLNTAASGASLGSAFGPIGAGIGGIVGGAVGFIGGLFRKNKMAERIRNALMQAARNNNFSLASALTDYLTNQYNVDHTNTQDDLLYSAKDGMVPGFDNGKANARVSNGEIIVDTTTGKAGRMPGKPNKKDSLLVHLDNPDGTAIVSNNKLADGIRNSDYFAMTGDLNGALIRDLIYRNMKDYRTVKLLSYGTFNAKNGIIPQYDLGKLPKVTPYGNYTYEDDPEINKHLDILDKAAAARDLYSTTETPIYPYTDKYKGTPFKIKTESNSSGGNYDNSNLANVITSGLGVLGGLTQYLHKNDRINAPDTYAPNNKEKQALDIYGWLNPATNRAVQAAAATEARNRYNINRMGGLSGAQKYLAAVQSEIRLQNNIASIIADANKERNSYRSQLAGAMMNAGTADAQRRQNANQYLDEAYARAHGARTQFEQMGMQNILAAFNQYYKNLEKYNRFMRTMKYYDQDYDLRRRELERGWR